MVLGFGFGYSQKNEPAGGGGSGPPFALTSANNGSSVDPTSFKIVWGNDATGVTGPAALLSDREIDFAGHQMRYFDAGSLPADLSTIFDPNDIQHFDSSINAHSLFTAHRILFEDTVTLETSVLQPASLDIANPTNELFAQPSGLAITDLVTNNSASLNSTGFSFIDGADGTKNIEISFAAGILSIDDSLGNPVFTFDAEIATGNFATLGMISAGSVTGGAVARMQLSGSTATFSNTAFGDILIITATANRVNILDTGFVNFFNGGQETVSIDGTAGAVVATIGDVNNQGASTQLIIDDSARTVTANADQGLIVTDSGPFPGLSTIIGIDGIEIENTGTASNVSIRGAANKIALNQAAGVTIPNMQIFATNALAIAGGLAVNTLYRNAVGVVSVVF